MKGDRLNMTILDILYIFGAITSILGILYLLKEHIKRILARLNPNIHPILKEINDNLQEIKKEIRFVKTLENIFNCGIINIFVNRHTSEAKEVLKKVLREAKGEILLAGVAFPNFFALDAEYYRDVLNIKLTDPLISFKILLLNPEGVNARERAELEKEIFTTIDIENSIIFLEKMKKSGTTKAKIDVHVYDFPPIAYLIITDEFMFIEQYHLAPSPRMDLGCIGGQVPFLQMNSNSKFYRVMKEHFMYVWQNKSSHI